MYCICCKENKVSPYEEDILWKKEIRLDASGSSIGTHNINNELVSDGIIQIIDAGYGSKHDTNQFIIAICDDCISENLNDGTILYYGNYMNYTNSNIDKRIEDSKKIYKRRKNLDNLI
jgi:hypothetical protein